MNDSKVWMALGLAASITCAGCGKDEEKAAAAAPPGPDPNAAAANPTPPSTTEVAAAPTPAPAAQPAPTPGSAADAAIWVPHQAKPVPQTERTYVVDTAKQKLKEVKTPKTDTERFQRYVSWLTLIKDGDAATKAEVMQQIKNAQLTPQEVMEFEKLRQYYGVRF